MTPHSRPNLTIKAGCAADVGQWFGKGNFDKAVQASRSMERTFVYLENGAIDLGGGSGQLRWAAPLCRGNSAMFHPGSYQDVTRWSESTAAPWTGVLTGKVGVGTLFTTNTLFFPTGQSGQF